MLAPRLCSYFMFKIISQNSCYHPLTDSSKGSEKLISLSKITQLEEGKVRIGALVGLTPNAALYTSYTTQSPNGEKFYLDISLSLFEAHAQEALEPRTPPPNLCGGLDESPNESL